SLSTLVFTVGGDSVPPKITVTSADPSLFLERPWTIEGTASDDSAIRDVVARVFDTLGAPVAVIVAACAACPAPSVSWTVNLSGLDPGSYYVVVRATDIYHNVVQAPIRVVALTSEVPPPPG
ncbi:MAG TPA: hypothetical protein VM600_01125, partial [Actinomycetota bacterium]|nr:hypothetical protein [Actinomycetota bacterium]